MDYVSIKNNCRTPYCSKLISEWTAYPNKDIATLAYVMIPRRLFDPIVDPDLIEYMDSASPEEEAPRFF